MPVIVNNNSIYPAPLVTIDSAPILAGDQRRIGLTYTLTIVGKLVSWKGSPQQGSLVGPQWGGPLGLFWQSSGYPPDETFVLGHGLEAIMIKQQALEELFSQDGSTIEFNSPDGSAPLKGIFKNAKVTYTSAIWVNECDYTITAECDILYLNGQILTNVPFPELIQSANETWNIVPNEAAVKTFNITHNVTAQGKRTFDILGNETPAAWQNAYTFANQRLVLGWTGNSSFSSIPGSGLIQTSSLASGNLNLSAYNAYNISRTQDIDELNGSVNITESWILAPTASSGTDVYTVSARRISTDPYTTINVSINGTLRGFYSNLFDYDQRILAAEWMWTQLSGTPLYNRVSAYASGIPLNFQPTAGNLDYNINDGSLTYNYEFSNRQQLGEAFETYTITRRTSVESYISTFSINGNIQGRRYDGDNIGSGGIFPAFTRALAAWNLINTGTLYNRIISSNFWPTVSSIGLQPSPINFNFDFNQPEGTVSYNYEFNNRKDEPIGTGLIPNPYSNSILEEFNMSQNFSRLQGYTTYTINGNIKGLNIADTADPRQAKYAAASGYWLLVAKPDLYNRIVRYYNISLPDPNPYSLEVGYNISAGEVTYNAQFYNYFPPILSGVLSEVISVNEENWLEDINTIADLAIPGRKHGSILQSINTTPAKLRTVNVEAILVPTGGPDLLSAFNTKPSYDSYVNQLAPTNTNSGPYIQESRCNWDWRNGHYTLTRSWKYT